MKKHIIAAAVAAAVAVPAMAQNVTVYGRVDAGYTDVDNKTNSASGIRYNSHTSSRIGFTGSEDIGGGLKASFGLEAGLGVPTSTAASTTQQAASGAAYTINTNGQDLSLGGFNRGAWLDLAGSFGALRAGLTDSATKAIRDGFSAGGASNTVGDLHSILENSYFGGRNTGIRYTMPATSGMTVNGTLLTQRALNGADAAAAASNFNLKTTAGTGYEIGASYTSGPLSIAFAQYHVEAARTTTNAATAALENTQSQTSIAASYDFGVAKVSVINGSTKLDATGGATVTKSNATEIGVRAPLGSSAILWASAAQGERGSDDSQGLQLGLQYNLSKRTYAYGIYGKTDLDATSVTTKQYSAGLVHLF